MAQLFRAVLATVQRRLERIRGRPCRQSDALEAMLDHARVLRCTGVAPDGLRFELGLRSDGPPLAVYRSGEVRVD